jgi:hypothetical protein
MILRLRGLFFLIILAVVFVKDVVAQEDSTHVSSVVKTITEVETEFNGYGAFSVGYTRVGDLSALAIGGRGVWLMNDRIGFGFSADGFRSQMGPSLLVEKDEAFYAGGYFGLLAEPSFFLDRKVHLLVPVILGGGGVTYNSNFLYNNPSIGNGNKSTELFFFFEPGVEFEMDMLGYLGMSLGVSYKVTSKLDLGVDVLDKYVSLLDKNGMNTLIVRLIFKFGKFKEN